jgi:predicted small secreted protein
MRRFSFITIGLLVAAFTVAGCGTQPTGPG